MPTVSAPTHPGKLRYMCDARRTEYLQRGAATAAMRYHAFCLGRSVALSIPGVTSAPLASLYDGCSVDGHRSAAESLPPNAKNGAPKGYGQT